MSDPALVAISRRFVCARLATWESADEGRFLESLGASRSGRLANTAYVLLAPDGKTRLSDAGRSPRMVYGGGGPQLVKALVADMKRALVKHPGDGKPLSAIPYAADLRRALNVAACDMTPLVVVRAESIVDQAKIEVSLAALIWGDAHRGRFAFAVVHEAADAKPIEGGLKLGVSIVEPGIYGLKGKVLAHSERPDRESLAALLARGSKAYAPKPKPVSLIEEGKRKGVYWKPEIPVTTRGDR